jgi:hypothetical protein
MRTEKQKNVKQTVANHCIALCVSLGTDVLAELYNQLCVHIVVRNGTKPESIDKKSRTLSRSNAVSSMLPMLL